jgi:protein O-GlcNAc transferase
VRRATALALSVAIFVALPSRTSSFAIVSEKPYISLQGSHGAAVLPSPHSLRTVVVTLHETSNGGGSHEPLLSPIEKAQRALENNDVQSAEEFLMTAVAEVNDAIMNHPKLTRCFEDLFRTKIKIALENDSDNIYDIARDRIGLASLLTDQSKYQEAADELELVVHSLSAMVTSQESQSQIAVVSTLDKASSLLFRTRAMVCDWSGYESSFQNLAKSTHRALSEDALPSVHPFEALAWPCLSLKDATAIAHEYAKRALSEANAAALATTTASANTNTNPNLPWTDLRDRLPRNNVPFVRGITERNHDASKHSKAVIRVGYLSPDFTGKHPLAFLMQDVFRFHNTSRFEIILYSMGGEPDGSPEVNKIVESDGGENTRSWKTLEGSVENMARTISGDKLDVLIDLCGYTGTSLVAQVMAFLRGLDDVEANIRAQQQSFKPIHVGYMGFPGSSGAPYIDYMIADEVVIPSKFRPFYSENILYMPHCYFVNSHWHIREERKKNNSNQNNEGSLPMTREHYGLPASPVFVFCCHSRPDKIDPSTFATWIRALKRTRDEGKVMGNPGMENTVIWLLRSEGTPQMEANLRITARAILGSEEEEVALVFCNQAPRQEHLKRLALADLFLDTPAYNAHTVGCDCLSAGVPMISLLLPWHRSDNSNNANGNGSDGGKEVPTEKLASRVGASLLKSAGTTSMLSDALVVASMEEYEDHMVECARSSTCSNNSNTNTITKTTNSFLSLKEHLLDQFSTAPLWDTERWVRNLETGLTTMVDLRSKESYESDIYVMDYSDIETH